MQSDVHRAAFCVQGVAGHGGLPCQWKALRLPGGLLVSCGPL